MRCPFDAFNLGPKFPQPFLLNVEILFGYEFLGMSAGLGLLGLIFILEFEVETFNF